MRYLLAALLCAGCGGRIAYDPDATADASVDATSTGEDAGDDVNGGRWPVLN